VRFQVLTAARMEMRASWDIAQCSLFEVEEHFRGAYSSFIRAMIEAVHTSETLVYFNEAALRYYLKKSYHLQNISGLMSSFTETTK
jgi:hypothetical protein